MPDKIPYFPFFPADWLTDPKVRKMNHTERGIFIDVLCYQWREGFIEDDSEAVRALVAYRGDDWEERWSNVCSTLVRSRSGLFNPRLRSEREKYLGMVERKKIAGVASGKARREKKLRSEHVFNKRSTHAEHKGNNTDTDTDTDKENTVCHAGTPARPAPAWFNSDYSIGATKEFKQELRRDYPEVSFDKTWRKANGWHKTAPPSKRKKKADRFLVRWFEREAHAVQWQKQHGGTMAEAYVASEKEAYDSQRPEMTPELEAKYKASGERRRKYEEEKRKREKQKRR